MASVTHCCDTLSALLHQRQAVEISCHTLSRRILSAGSLTGTTAAPGCSETRGHGHNQTPINQNDFAPLSCTVRSFSSRPSAVSPQSNESFPSAAARTPLQNRCFNGSSPLPPTHTQRMRVCARANVTRSCQNAVEISIASSLQERGLRDRQRPLNAEERRTVGSACLSASAWMKQMFRAHGNSPKVARRVASSLFSCHR